MFVWIEKFTQFEIDDDDDEIFNLYNHPQKCTESSVIPVANLLYSR